MKKYFLALLMGFMSVFGHSQFIIFLYKGDIFKSPEEEMVVMDRYSFARMNYVAEKYDTLRKEVTRYDSLLTARDSAEVALVKTYKQVVSNKDAQIEAITDGYISLKSALAAAIDEQNRLQVEFLKLQARNKRVRKWRNFFMGTSALAGAIIYMVVR
jgi:hypothetical protein